MNYNGWVKYFAFLLSVVLFSCERKPADSAEPIGDLPQLDVTSWAQGCYALRSGDRWMVASDGGYAFSATSLEGASPFRMQPTDLGTYLFYDSDGGYLVAGDDGSVSRETSLQSDMTEQDDTYVSGGEWVLETAVDGERYQLCSRRTTRLLAEDGLTSKPRAAAPITFEETTGCAEFPELSVDASGTVTQTTFDDGALYGLVDSHSHILSNFGFGGGGIFHGGAFHRLGVEHALPDCAPFHGEAGRRDVFGYAYDNAGNDSSGLVSVFADLLTGELSEDNHVTAGYPDFTEWPDARNRATHQQQYHRWLERAWMGGLRLVVQHATTNSVICNLTVGEGLQSSRYDCEDMTAVDRIIDETYNMERYIDALHGGEGEGWFRIVRTPAEARAVIEDGKMAVILGIETSDLFNCHLTPRPGAVACDEEYVMGQLDAYYERGVRAIFPVHKYDNQFTPGDGSTGFIELGNFINSGHWTNKVQDCPTDETMPTGFDGGGVSFSELNQPREEFLSPAPNDFSAFPEAPIDTLLGYAGKLLGGGEGGSWCQNAGLTPLGEALIDGLMDRGMIIEVDHLPRWSYQQAYDILEENDYPAAGTHNRHWEGRIFELGGIASFGMERCQDADNPGSAVDSITARADLIAEKGGYPGVTLGFDLNGFAGGARPRFGEDGCGSEQPNPMSYPFTSYAGDVTFTEPYVGNRAIDFDTEGMVHIGMLPELIQDARADALDDADIEPLFRGAEAYIRMWELAEARAASR